MRNGYYGYRRKRRSPLLFLIVILVVAAAGFWAWRTMSGSSEKVIPKEVKERENIPDPDIEELIPLEEGEGSTFWILVDKSDFRLYLYEGRELRGRYPVAIGLVSGDKEKPGDNRTPEGSFKVVEIEDSRHWVYDFGDGKGPVEGAYGPWFIRLETGWEGIGIHGTHDPDSMGSRCTAGCIRMINEDLLEIVSRIDVGSPVFIRD